MKYFGQYGKILKVVVNRSQLHGGDTGDAASGRLPSASAYVTFAGEEAAREAIQSVDGITVESRVIRASLGTTKYVEEKGH